MEEGESKTFVLDQFEPSYTKKPPTKRVLKKRSKATSESNDSSLEPRKEYYYKGQWYETKPRGNVTYIKLQLLFPIAIAFYNFERGAFLPDWSQTAGFWHIAVTPMEYRVAMLIYTIAALIITFNAVQGGRGSLSNYFLMGYATATILDILFHLAATIFLFTLSPGLITCALFIVPVMGLLLKIGIEEEYVYPSILSFFTVLMMLVFYMSTPLLYAWGRSVDLSKT